MRVMFQNIIAYSPAEAAKAFAPSCGEQAIRRALRSGELTAHKVGPRRYILRETLLAWIEQQKDYAQ